MTTTEPRAGELPATPAVAAALARLERQNAAALGEGERLDIASVAERTGVTAHTLRYYERIGLLDIERDASGHRSYSAADYGRVVFLTRLRMTGMPVRDMQRYVALAAKGPATVPERLALLQDHRDQVRAQIAELTFALRTIETKIDTYGGELVP